MSGPLAQLASLFGPLEPAARPLLPGVYLVLGIASLGWGASVWRWVRVASGLLLGVWAGTEIGVVAHDARVGLVAGAVLAVGAAVLFYMVERAAVAALGGAVAVLVMQVAWPLVHSGQSATTLVNGVAALVGTLLGAFLHQPVIKAVTAIFGAFLICQALEVGDRLDVAKLRGGDRLHVVVVLALAGCGWAWQMRGGGSGGGAAGKARKRKER